MDSRLVIMHLSIIGYSDDDETVDKARSSLRRDLKDAHVQVEDVIIGHDEGSKGLITDLAVLLSTRGLITGVVRIVHLWLSQDPHRSVRLTTRLDGESTLEVEIVGDGVSEQIIHNAIKTILDRPNRELS